MKAVPVALAACAMLLLSGCTGSGTTTAKGDPAPGPTVTVTATPSAAARNPADALTALDAWIACAATAKKSYDFDQQVTGTKWSSYTADAVKAGANGTFRVTVGFTPKGAPAADSATCTVGGTLASPVIVDFALQDQG